MYRDTIDKMILAVSKEVIAETDETKKTALKEKVAVYRLIKAEYLMFKTAKNAKPLDDEAELKILRKMIATRNGAIEEYLAGNRKDLADKEANEIKIIEELLPVAVPVEDIEKKIVEIINTGVEASKKNMRVFMASVKEAYPTAEDKIIASTVLKYLN